MKINEIPPFEFKSFSRKQLKMLTWWQDNSPVSDRFMIVADGSIRSGKAQYIGQHVYTPDGYKLMGDIKVGDYVVDRLGNPTKVLGVYPQGEKECYRITFHDGSSTICSNEHLFSYTTKKCAQNGNLTVYTSTLEEIMKDLGRFKNRKTVHERSGKYLFPLAKCVKFNSREVKIDPYLLGLLLGDGCFSEKTSRITVTNAEDELHDYIRNILQKYSMSYVYIPKNDNHCAYGRLQNKVGVHGKLLLRELLEEYGLYGKKSAEKFIPDDYKYNSEEVRLNILAGILNTDGSVHVKNRPSIVFYSNSKQLVDDVAEIARSLGLFCNTDIAVDTHMGNPNYSCTIRVKEKLYNLLSEKHRARLNMDSTKDKKWRLIKSIEYVGKQECQCIYVDNPEHLYLTDDFIVTHNTIACITSFILYVMTNYNYMNAAVGGKSLNVDSEIPTPNGIKKLKDIQIGDYVYNRKGKAVKVLGVFPQGKLDSYNITFNDGTKVNCSADHLWSYYSRHMVAKGDTKLYTSTTSDIINSLSKKNIDLSNIKNFGKYRFPINYCVEFLPREVKIDPYLLGLLLGDGCFSENNSGITFINEEQELQKYVKNIVCNYNIKYSYKSRNEGHCGYSRLMCDTHNGKKSKLRELLEYYGLFGKKSHTKFIPNDYKFNSRHVRYDVLAGLLNTGGNVSRGSTSKIRFCTVSKQLYDDVSYVARSLGLLVNTSCHTDCRDKNKHTCYNLSIQVDKDLYSRLSKKHKDRFYTVDFDKPKYRIIKSVEYAGKTEQKCLYVDDDEHLFLVNDFIVTHNTVLSLRRNIVQPLKQIAKTLNMEIIDHRSENYLEVIKGDVSNYLYLFGGKDEASQDLVQGLTLCSCFLDEVALMPESFYNQITARLSVEGAKVWTTSNPSNPQHWFYKNVICKLEDMNGLYVHFTMDDNPSLSDDVKERYKSMYSGVWAKRFIEGLVTLALVKYV